MATIGLNLRQSLRCNSDAAASCMAVDVVNGCHKSLMSSVVFGIEHRHYRALAWYDVRGYDSCLLVPRTTNKDLAQRCACYAYDVDGAIRRLDEWQGDMAALLDVCRMETVGGGKDGEARTYAALLA